MRIFVCARPVAALVLACVFVTVFGRIACAPLSAAESTTGAIAGTVLDSTGHAVAGARVAAASPSGRYTFVTDARGKFSMLGIVPDTYVVTVEKGGFDSGGRFGVAVLPGQTETVDFRISLALRTIGVVRASAASAFHVGDPTDTFVVTGAAAQAHAPVAGSSGLGAYAEGSVQGAIANVPGVDSDAFENAVLRGGRVSDAVFDYDSLPIPQGLIVEPGGNVAGAQLPTTGIASTTVALAGYEAQSDNALGGVINQIPAIGTYPGRAALEIGQGIGDRFQYQSSELLGATPDLGIRYALASTVSAENFVYGDGRFLPAEAGTYGLAIGNRAQYSIEGNVHVKVGAHDDVSLLGLVGEAEYDQYASPYAGETIGAFDGTATNGAVVPYPSTLLQAASVPFASGVRGSYGVVKLAWVHSGARLLSRVQLYRTQDGASAGGPFWDENGFPNGTISLAETNFARQTGINYDGDGVFGRHHLRFGAEYRIGTSYLDQVVPTADELITSQPTLDSYLAYVGDTWEASSRLDLTGTARLTGTHVKPSDGFAYDVGALDPHLGFSYRIGANLALRANFDHITVAPAPLEADRSDSTNVDANGNPAPFAPLAPETANDFTYSFEGGRQTQFRLTYYQKFEQNLIDVLPFDFRGAVSSGLSPNGVGVPTNVGLLRANGLELNLHHGGIAFNANYSRAFSSSASQFAYNDLNAPAIAAGHLFPVSYQPDFASTLSFEVDALQRRLRVTPSLSYETGYPYGNGRMVYTFDGTGKPVQVPNDNYVNPGANYYFLQNPSLPYNAASNPYIANLGTNEGNDPNTLRSPPQILANLHVEADITPRLTAVVDVANLFGNFSPTEYQVNPYLIGPPGYKGGNPLYAAAYANTANFTQPYALGNGVPTNDGVTQSVPWSYGTAGYVPQSYPLGRTVEVRLRYRL